MLKNGQIEDKEAVQLKKEIDMKIYYLQMHQPEIKEIDQQQRIMFYSELADIFDKKELHEALDNMKIEEKMYNPREPIPNVNERIRSVVYVARGTVVEKYGDYDDINARQLRYKRGKIACL